MNRSVGWLIAGLVLVGLGGVLMFPYFRTTSAEPSFEPNANQDKFAQDRNSKQPEAIAFDGKRAIDYLEEICKIGPRISGSDGMKEQQKLLQTHFGKHGATVTWQEFEGKQPSRREKIPMKNMIISWNTDSKRRILLCGHYDTRPIADQEPRREDWFKPFVSANDGTSTVAFFMELAHHMKTIPLKVGVDFVLFDGEECIYDNKKDKFFLGSEYFAVTYAAKPPAHKYTAAILLDLFAGKDAWYPIEENSRFFAGSLVEEVWKEAYNLGIEAFAWQRGPEVLDDHIALNRAGIPAIDIIDFNYEHWHRLSDLPKQCSPNSMINVAKVLTAWMQRQK